MILIPPPSVIVLKINVHNHMKKTKKKQRERERKRKIREIKSRNTINRNNIVKYHGFKFPSVVSH